MSTFTSKVVALFKRNTTGSVQENAGAAIHSAIALVSNPVAVLLGPYWWLVAIANTVFWFWRETTQTDKDIKLWSRHKHVEWIAPSLTGTIASYVTNLLT